MNENPLQFPDAPRSELESTIDDLVERAQRALAAQGRLRSLLDATRTIVEDLDLDRALVRIAEAAVRLVHARYGALGVFDSDGRLERFVHVGMPATAVEAIGHLPEGRGLLGAVIDSGETIRLDHLGDDPRSAGFPARHPRMETFLGVPIRVRDDVFGNLYLTDREDGPFTEEDEELVRALAATAGVAIDNARLYEEARRRQRLSTALSEVASTLLSPAAGDALGVVAERVASVVPAELVAVVVPGPGDDQVRVDTARGVGAEALENAVYPAKESLAARAIAAETIVTADGAERTILDDRIRVGPTIAAPLTVSGSTIGALCVSRGVGDAAFTHAELATVSEFAVQAGLAIALAWARRDRERLELIEDRSRIARDLHDNVIQRLFATGLGLQALATADPDHAAAIDTHVAEIDTAIADIRTAVFTLTSRPPSATTGVRHRLLGVVTELTPTLATAPRITFAGPVDLMVTGQLGDDVVAVVREALANVARHAHAETSTVDVAVGDNAVTVTVDDDGVGIGSVDARASGIRNLASRAQEHGGTFTIELRAPRGTRVRWSVPLDPGSAR